MLKQSACIAALLVFLMHVSCRTEEEPLVIAFTGDVLLDRGVRKQIEQKGVDYLLEAVAPEFHSSDAVIINLECPVTDTVSPVNKRYIFRANPEWMERLHANGITHAALANNHSSDQGRQGLASTARHLTRAGIIPLGYGENQTSACAPVFISKHGIEAAVFNSVLIPLENWVYLEDEPGICQATIESLCSEIQSLKTQKPACYAVVVLHWGIEFQSQPAPRQRNEAYRLIEAGADVIVGHHPHVVQKEEVYKGKTIFYSLGNFVFDPNKPETSRSLLLQMKLRKTGIAYTKRAVKIRKCRPLLF